MINGLFQRRNKREKSPSHEHTSRKIGNEACRPEGGTLPLKTQATAAAAIAAAATGGGGLLEKRGADL